MYSFYSKKLYYLIKCCRRRDRKSSSKTRNFWLQEPKNRHWRNGKVVGTSIFSWIRFSVPPKVNGRTLQRTEQKSRITWSNDTKELCSKAISRVKYFPQPLCQTTGRRGPWWLLRDSKMCQLRGGWLRITVIPRKSYWISTLTTKSGTWHAPITNSLEQKSTRRVRWHSRLREPDQRKLSLLPSQVKRTTSQPWLQNTREPNHSCNSQLSSRHRIPQELPRLSTTRESNDRSRKWSPSLTRNQNRTVQSHNCAPSKINSRGKNPKSAK